MKFGRGDEIPFSYEVPLPNALGLSEWEYKELVSDPKENESAFYEIVNEVGRDIKGKRSLKEAIKREEDKEKLMEGGVVDEKGERNQGIDDEAFKRVMETSHLVYFYDQMLKIKGLKGGGEIEKELFGDLRSQIAEDEVDEKGMLLTLEHLLKRAGNFESGSRDFADVEASKTLVSFQFQFWLDYIENQEGAMESYVKAAKKPGDVDEANLENVKGAISDAEDHLKVLLMAYKYISDEEVKQRSN